MRVLTGFTLAGFDVAGAVLGAGVAALGGGLALDSALGSSI